MKLLEQIKDAQEYNFFWLWRFLFTWDLLPGKRLDFDITFFKKDRENELWWAEFSLHLFGGRDVGGKR
jgi:hypothetical protein